MRSSRASLVESGAGSKLAEKFGHTMDAARDHRGRHVMRAGNDIGDDVGIGRIRGGGFEDADHRAHAVANAAEADRFAQHVGILFEDGRPEAVGENDDTGGVGTIILRADQAAENRMKAHHFEVGAAYHTPLNFAGLAEADHREADLREIAELLDGVNAGLNVLDFGHGKGGVFVAHAGRALADVDEAVLVAVDERLEQDAANEREDGRVGSDAERQGEDHDDGESWRAAEGVECNS